MSLPASRHDVVDDGAKNGAPAMAPPAAAHADTNQRSQRAQRDEQLAALVIEAAAGSAAAFEAFYDATAAYASALARRMLRSADLDDLLADAFFEAWRTAPRFAAARGSAVSWLLTIVRSRCLDQLRRQAVQRRASAETTTGEAGSPQADPAWQHWQTQSNSRLQAALQGLSTNERWVIGLAYFRDLSHADIAQATGLPLGTVKSLILRAQVKLRAALQD